jgi:hypothetical protein
MFNRHQQKELQPSVARTVHAVPVHTVHVDPVTVHVDPTYTVHFFLLTF